MDLVSVIIPYYKKRNFVKETLDSVINQDYGNLEVLIIYDDKNKVFVPTSRTLVYRAGKIPVRTLALA